MNKNIVIGILVITSIVSMVIAALSLSQTKDTIKEHERCLAHSRITIEHARMVEADNMELSTELELCRRMDCSNVSDVCCEECYEALVSCIRREIGVEQ